MADAWGGSWGPAWGVSWGYTEERPGGGAASGPGAGAGKRRGKRIEWLDSLPEPLRRAAMFKRPAEEIVTTPRPAQKPRLVRHIGPAVAWRDEEEELLMILQACFVTGVV